MGSSFNSRHVLLLIFEFDSAAIRARATRSVRTHLGPLSRESFAATSADRIYPLLHSYPACASSFLLSRSEYGGQTHVREPPCPCRSSLSPWNRLCVFS